MFTGSLRETQQTEITLGDVHGDALHLLVQYCYTGEYIAFNIFSLIIISPWITDLLV